MTDHLLSFRCGDTYTIRLTFTVDAVPLDLTGCRVSWTVRSTYTLDSTSDADALIAKVATDGGPSGIIDFDLSASDTRVPPGTHVCDVQVVRDGNVVSSEKMLVPFRSDVTKDVV